LARPGGRATDRGRGSFNCANAKGENFSAEALFLILIFEQQKMISRLIAKLSDMKKLKE
jgi:hypothetical protein